MPITAEGNEFVVMITEKIAMSTYQLITGAHLLYTLLDDSPFPSQILMHRIDIASTSNVRYAFLFLYLRDHRSLFMLFSTIPKGSRIVDFATRNCSTMKNDCALPFEKNVTMAMLTNASQISFL